MEIAQAEMKVIDKEYILANFGVEAAEAIQRSITHCEQDDRPWCINVLEEFSATITFAFITRAYSVVYQVSKRRKKIIESYIVGHSEARKLLQYMDRLEVKLK